MVFLHVLRLSLGGTVCQQKTLAKPLDRKVYVGLSVQVSAYVTITNMHMHNITLPIYMCPCSAVCTHRATTVQFSLLLFFVLQLPCVLIAEVAGD